MINSHRLMSFFMDANLDHFYQTASLPSNQNILTTMSTKKLTCENKQGRQITTTEGPAVTNEFLTAQNQCIYGTRTSIFGNQARYSATQILTDSRERTLLRRMTNCTREQESTCGHRALTRFNLHR